MSDDIAPVKCLTLADLRAAWEGLPDSTIMVISTAEADFPAPYERAVLDVAIRDYGNVCVVELRDFPHGLVA